MSRSRRAAMAAAAVAAALALSLVASSSAQAHPRGRDASLAPRTHFTMAADGSSGATQGGEGIPNIDVVKKTIAAYYGDPGTGIADKTTSPYITEITKIVKRATAKLPAYFAAAKKSGRT